MYLYKTLYSKGTIFSLEMPQTLRKSDHMPNTHAQNHN